MKTVGALGLTAGLAFRPLGVAARDRAGFCFFVCAHLHPYPCQRLQPRSFYLANGFLALNVAALSLALHENELQRVRFSR